MEFDPEMIVRPRLRFPSLSSLASGGPRWIAIGIAALILLTTTFYSVATDERSP